MQHSSRLDMIPSYPGRPPVVSRDGWTEYVAVHDRGYLATKRAWKRKMVLSHPDREGTHAKFLSTMRSYNNWCIKERLYYWKLNLMPPDWRGPMEEPPGFKQGKSGRLIPQFVGRNW